MAIPKDPRYDVLFCDVDANGNANKKMGLVLRESGGAVDFGVQAVSPYANRITQGDLQDSDFSRGTVRTQRDWTGGFGKLFTYKETDSYLEGTADTRFKNQVIIGPKVRRSRFYSTSDPEYLGEGAANTTTKVQSEWVKRDTLAFNASAKWEASGKEEKSWEASDDISPFGDDSSASESFKSYASRTNSRVVSTAGPLGETETYPDASYAAVAGNFVGGKVYFNFTPPVPVDDYQISQINRRKIISFTVFLHNSQYSVSNAEAVVTVFDQYNTVSKQKHVFLAPSSTLAAVTFDLNADDFVGDFFVVKIESLNLNTLWISMSNDIAANTLDQVYKGKFSFTVEHEWTEVKESLKGSYIVFRYRNRTGSTVSLNKIFIDCQASADGSFILAGSTNSNINPNGSSASWTKPFDAYRTRRWIEVSLPSPVSVINNGAYWFAVLCNPSILGNQSISVFYSTNASENFYIRTFDSIDSFTFGESGNVSGKEINFQINTLVSYGDPDTRAGQHVYWNVLFGKSGVVSSVQIQLQKTFEIGGGCPVYFCVSKSPIVYSNGTISSNDPDFQKISISPTFTKEDYLIPVNFISVSSGTVLYMAVIVIAITSAGRTNLSVFGSSRDGYSVDTYSILGTRSTKTSYQNQFVYCSFNEGNSSDFPYWGKLVYKSNEISAPFQFKAAYNRNHTLRLKMKVGLISSSTFIPNWTLGAYLKISVMNGATEFASKTFSFSEAFPNGVENTPFGITEKWVAFDFGTKSSAANTTYTIKVTPYANASVTQSISVFVYGSSDATSSKNVYSASYDYNTGAFGTPVLATSSSKNGRLYQSWFSSNDMPTTDNLSERSSVYWHEYYGIDRRIAWTIVSKAESSWPLASVRFHAKLVKWLGDAKLTLKIYNNNGGEPGTTLLSSADVSSAVFGGISSKSGWVTVSLPSVYSVSSSRTTLWVALECDTPGVDDKIEFDITCGKNGNYQTRLSSATDGLPFGSWSADGLISANVSSYQSSTRTITTTAAHAFKAGMRVKIGSSVYEIESIGSSTIKTKTSVSPAPSASASIVEVIDYDPIWILNNGSGSIGQVQIPPINFGGKWYCAGGTQLYQLNASSQNVASGRVASYNSSTSTITLQSSHSFVAGMYIAVLDNVRKITGVSGLNLTLDSGISPAPSSGDIVSGSAVWVAVYTFASKIECVASLGDYMYVGLGEAASCQRGSIASGVFSFSAIADGTSPVYGKYMRQHLGYLYISRAVGGTNSLRATNGDLTKWDKITVGTADIEVTALATLGANLIVLSKTKMFEISSIYASHMYNYEIEANTNNGRGSIQWVADGRLYIPIKNGLNAFDGVKMTPVGPEQDYGLPNKMQGYVSCMSGTKDFLFASIDAGSSGYSSVLAWNGRGWHTIYKSPEIGRTIQAIGMEAITDSRPRLWIFEGFQASYITFPNLTDNPYQYVGAEYDSDDYFVSSWFGGELSAVLKDMQSVFIKADDCSQTSTITVELEADNSGVWHKIGEVTESPYVEFLTEPPNISAKRIVSVNSTGARTIIYVDGTVGDVTSGMFVSVNNEVRQVSRTGTTSANIGFIELANSLLEDPSAGDLVLPSRPVGKEFRYRVTLKNNGDSSKSPRLVRVSFRMQEYTLGRFRFSLSAVIDDEVLLRTGAVDRDTEATDYRAEIYSWMKRTTPFVMVAPDGKNWRVKIMSGSESSWTRKEIGQNNQRFSSVIQLQLDEV